MVSVKNLQIFFNRNKNTIIKRGKSIEIIKKYNDSKFIVKPTGDKVADNYFRKLFKSYKVKGQFLVALKDAYLLTSWSIPVTKNGQILIETSGKLGLLILNIMENNYKYILPEYKFFLHFIDQNN